MSKHTITIDIDNGALIDQCASQILAQYHGDYDDDGELIDNGKHQPNKQIDRVIRETVIAQIRKRLDETILAITKEHITTAIESILAEGWQKTDDYGQARGPKLTLKDRIAEQIASVRDQYNRKTWLDELVQKRLEETFTKEFAKPIEEAKAKFRSMLDGTIAAKLQEALKSSLGLR